MLMVAMMAIALMTIQGTIAMSSVLNNIAKSTKNSISQEGTSTSDAAISEAKVRLKGTSATNSSFAGDTNATSNYTASNPTLNWSAYLLTSTPWQASKDPEYTSTFTNYFPTSSSLTNSTITVNSAQQTIPYWIKMRHKREYDAEQYGHRTTSPHYTDSDGSTTLHTTSSRGNVIYYGYISPTSAIPVQFTTSLITNYPQVDIAMIYSELNGTTQKVQAEVARDVGPPIPGAMYSRGNVNFMVAGAIVSGTDQCAVKSRSPLYILSPATLTGTASYSGSPSTTATGTIDVDIAGFIQKYKGGGTVITADQTGGGGYGSSTNYVTVYSNTSDPLNVNVNGLSLNQLTGYGLLLVDGDLTLDKNFTWYGLVLVTGTLTFNTSVTGASDDVIIRGGILAGSIVGYKQEFDVRYDSCQIARAMGTKPTKLLSWRKL